MGMTSTTMPEFGAGLWHFASYIDRYATDGYGAEKGTLAQIALAAEVDDLHYVDLNFPFTDGVSTSEVKDALKASSLKAIGVTPDIYMREWRKGAFTNPDPKLRISALDRMHAATEAAAELGAHYTKIWPGQDGWDYPFQVNHGDLWKLAKEGMKELASAHPDRKFAIEYKPREPRVKMTWDSAARSILGIQEIGLDNIGVLLDFGHSLYGGESPADAAQLLIDHGLLYGMDVNDNLRAWDDDLVVGTVHMTEIFEFFHTLRLNGWHGVWQLDQFPFREDPVDAANTSIRFLKALHRALDTLDVEGLRQAQERQDAMAAQRLVQDALLSSMGGSH